jgi:hypothetical protein
MLGSQRIFGRSVEQNLNIKKLEKNFVENDRLVIQQLAILLLKMIFKQLCLPHPLINLRKSLENTKKYKI